MSEPEDFLQRWSRRKREVTEKAAAETANPETDSAADVSAGDENTSEPVLAKGEAGETERSVFDISKLPSVESITAETDIRPFLATGVPAHLTQAALRKLWVTDPKIRDFIEIAENQWDFNAGNIPGFDYSLPENAKELVAQIFSKTPEPVEKFSDQPAASEPQSAPSQTSISAEPEPITTPVALGPSSAEAAVPAMNTAETENAADFAHIEQQAEESDATSAPLARRHGSALPS
jgi:hypothetical protein